MSNFAKEGGNQPVSDVCADRIKKCLREAIETSSNPTILLEKDLRIIAANQSFLKYFRADSAAIQGELLFGMQNGIWNLPELRILFNRLLPDHNRITGHEVRLQYPDMDLRCLSVNASRIQDPDAGDEWIVMDLEDKNVSQEAEKPFNMPPAEERKITTIRDAAELGIRMKERDQEHQQKEEILENIFNSTHFLMAYLDRNFNFIRVNRAYALADEHEPDYYSDKNHFDLFPDHENEKIFKQVLKTGEPYTAYAKEFAYADHPERGLTYWDWSIQPVKNGSGEIVGLLMILVDVSKRRNTEIKLGETQEALNKAQRLSDIGALAAMVAHELRNPLGVISTALYNTRRKINVPEVSKHLDRIEKKVNESERIINNILHYARVKPPECEMTRIDVVLEECAASIRKSALKDGVEIRLDFGEPANLEAWLDPVQFREIVNNILLNSLQALEKQKDGIILISLIKEDDKKQFTIMIRDNGPGIQDQKKDRLFEPFYTKKAKGTGLGLAICKQMVELYNGAITIQNHPEGGAEVTIVLPLRNEGCT